MKAYIKAIDYYLPQRIVTNEELAQDFPEWSVEKIMDKVGVNQRIAADDETATNMAISAARKLFDNGIDKQMIDYHLSIDDTLLIKGMAICLMLWHHLFYENPEYGTFIFQTAQFGKVCVALFLFVSAYGLTIQFNSITVLDTFKFQMKRFVKFYANYWVIFLIFVPIGVFVFGRQLSAAYGGGHWLKMLFTDFLGINGEQSYNATCWFNQLIDCSVAAIN